MRLTKLTVNNFRSFGPMETSISLKDMSVFIGGNSTGKTTAMQALVKIFGVHSRDREFVRSDFHIPPGVTPENINESTLYIEAIIEFGELVAHGNTGGMVIPPLFNQMVVNVPGGNPYIRVRLTATWQRGNTPDGDIDTRLDFITVAEFEPINETAMIPVKAHQRSLIQAFYVPAMRDPRTQLKNDSGTILYRLFKAIKWTPGLADVLKAKGEEVNNLFLDEPGVRTVESFVKNQWKEFHNDVRYSNTGLGFSATELEKILKRVEVYFKPTPEEKSYTIDQLGDGLRSLFYIALVSAMLKLESDYPIMPAEAGIDIDSTSIPVLTILALEEPENHLSPHLLGRVISLLHNLSTQSNAQVIISSHTPAVLQRVDPETILYFKILAEDCHTCVKAIELPPTASEAYKYIKEAVRAYPELYFAKAVILGEGDSEELILAKTLQKREISTDRSFLSIVPLGGRHVNHFWRLLNQLDIPHYTILDLDREREGGGWGRIKYVFNQLIAIGVPRDEVLNIEFRDGRHWEITQAYLEEMHGWAMEPEQIDWMNELIFWLRRYGVFFSTPLDIDFMMLKAFPAIYKGATEGTGPKIPERTETEAFSRRIAAATAATLKDAGGDGSTYSDEDKELFIWYSYLFLGRGKPVTHLLALKDIETQAFLDNLPEPIRALIDAVLVKIGEGQAQDGTPN